MLQGIELIDCAKANAKQGIAVAAKQSDYEQDIALFQKNLAKACQEIGVNIDELSDLITDQQKVKENHVGLDIAPDTTTQL